jgi:hypothetical protein
MVPRRHLDVGGDVANVDRLGHSGRDWLSRLDGLSVGAMNSDRREQQDRGGKWDKIHLHSFEYQ